jgi:iron complex outermembrane receptor protein
LPYRSRVFKHHGPSAISRALLLTTVAVAGAASSGAVAQEAEELPALVVETTDQVKKKRKKPANATDTRLTDVGGTPGEVQGSGTQPTGGAGGPVAGGGGITGASTSIITREQIERAPQATLPDIIAREAGIQTSSLYGGVNGVGTTIDMRGFGITGASNTLVLINGRRLNDWDSPGFDLSTIARDSIERIEITRGNSGAVLYGDGAVGGVINIVTRSGTDLPNQARIEGGLGSFETREGNISASGSSGRFSTFVNGNYFESDGYRLNNETRQRSAVGDFRWSFDRGGVFLNLAADDQELGLPGERRVFPGGADEVRTDPRGTHKPFDYADKQGMRGTVGFNYMLSRDVELIVDGGVRTKAQQAGFFSPFEENYVDTDLTTTSLTPRVNVTLPFFGLPSRALAGVDFYDTDYESHRSMFEGLAPIHIYDGGQQTLAGYWQQTVSVLPTTDISAGGRVQWNETTARDTYDPLAPQGFPGLEGLPLDNSETNHAWHLGAEHELVPGVTLLGRVAQSFRVANIDERIGSALFGVPTDFDLRTQKSDDWEAGVRFQFGAFEIQSSYYEMRLTDELHFDPVNFINTNLDPTRRRGAETIASWQVMKDVRLRGNLTYTDAEFRAGPFAGNDVPLVSPWTGNVALSWDIIEKWLTLDAAVNYVGERRMDNDQGNVQPLISDHTTVDVRLAGEIDQFFWSAGVQNLFDVDYFDYAVASMFTLGRYNAYPQPGRTFIVKAGTTW